MVSPKTKEMFRSAMFSFTAESVRRAFSCEERIMYKGSSAYPFFETLEKQPCKQKTV